MYPCRKMKYHKHIGSASQVGGCYNYTAHVHVGSARSYGGCYRGGAHSVTDYGVCGGDWYWEGSNPDRPYICKRCGNSATYSEIGSPCGRIVAKGSHTEYYQNCGGLPLNSGIKATCGKIEGVDVDYNYPIGIILK